METFFADLGRAVATQWQSQNFSLARFPALAAAALAGSPPSANVDLAHLIADFLLSDDQPFQTQSGFGQPELIVFDHPRFYIQLLFWMEGATDIHQHEFSGAFHVMQGSSIHSEFAFDDVRPISAHFRVGALRLKSIKLLETGSTVPIISGRDHIHSLFHLDTPSISIVIRTHHDPGSGPQFTYLPPHIALDPVQNDPLTTRRKQLLDVLERTADSSYVPLLLDMLASLDFERGFFILQNGMAHLQALGQWDRALSVFRTKHGALSRGVPATLAEIVRRDRLVSMRATVTEPEHRFFLALLLNVPDRHNILTLVKKRFPGPPVATILRWAAELLETNGLATWLLDAAFPPEIPVPCEDQPAILLAVLHHRLAPGKSPPALPLAHLKAVETALAASSLSVLLG